MRCPKRLMGSTRPMCWPTPHHKMTCRLLLCFGKTDLPISQLQHVNAKPGGGRVWCSAKMLLEFMKL